MYPIRLNLLSPDKRKFLQRMIYVQFIKNTFTSIVFVFCVSGITLLGGQWVLQEYFNDVSGNLVATTSKQVEKNKKIKEVNSLINQTDIIQQVYTPWSDIIIDISNAVPNGIVLTNISLNSGNKNFVFSGNADTRDNLLEMQKNLKALSFIEDVKIPVSQLTEKENFPFTIPATYKK